MALRLNDWLGQHAQAKRAGRRGGRLAQPVVDLLGARRAVQAAWWRAAGCSYAALLRRCTAVADSWCGGPERMRTKVRP